MSMQLTLPPQLEERLKQEAARRGMTADACAIQTLDQHLPPVDRAAQLQALFDQWAAEDQAAEPCHGDYDFFKEVDAARPSNRKLYPDELKGITW
jgi:hypothetical protein